MIVDPNVTNLITERYVQEIVKVCKALYMNGKKQVLFRTATKTREVVCENVEPYLEKVNKEFAQWGIPVSFVVDSVYSNFFSSHPTYFLSVLSASSVC